MKTNKEIKTVDWIIDELRKKESQRNREGMSRFGINTEKAFGVSVKDIKLIAKEIKKDHKTAVDLWETEIHEARIMSTLIDEIELVTEEQAEKMVLGFDSWDICDLACLNIFVKTQFCEKKIKEWAFRDETFVKRAGFALIACAAVHQKKWDDQIFIDFFQLIEQGLTDERNFVKKAVNWALRGIGKRNMNLNKNAIEFAEKFLKSDSKATRWIVSDAFRELKDEKILNRLNK